MEKWIVVELLLAFLVHYTAESTFLDTYDWISIDCGAETYNLDINTMINWEPDGEYISTGKNKNVTGGNDITLQMKTLRYFPVGDTNCYSFSVDGIEKYLVRARFLYGNYDGLSKPPTFDVEINGFKWTTVAISLSEEPIVIEGIFSPSSDVMSVCLARSAEGDIPFISSLEVTKVDFNVYRMIYLRKAFLLYERATFGRNEDIVYNGSSSGDIFNRIWKAKGLPNYSNISRNATYINYIETQPPDDVFYNGIEALSASDSIVLPLNLSQTNQSLCVMLYFMEFNHSRRPGDIRKFQIDLGSLKNVSTVDLEVGEPQLATLFPEWVVGPINITISPVQGSTLPPILNAMEVYRVMDMGSQPPTVSRAESLINSVAPLCFFLFLWIVYLDNLLASI